MGYIKQGFQLAIGMCLGKAVFDLTDHAVGRIMNHVIPEKYRNKEHPDYPIQPKAGKSDKIHSQNPIGFKAD